jgi:hypothetical protein
LQAPAPELTHSEIVPVASIPEIKIDIPIQAPPELAPAQVTLAIPLPKPTPEVQKESEQSGHSATLFARFLSLFTSSSEGRDTSNIPNNDLVQSAPTLVLIPEQAPSPVQVNISPDNKVASEAVNPAAQDIVKPQASSEALPSSDIIKTMRPSRYEGRFQPQSSSY